MTTIFGLAHYATTLTILAFFVGFALGAYLAKRYADQIRNALVMVVALETVIAVCGGLSFYAFDIAREINATLSLTLVDSRIDLLGARSLLCLALLLVPTVCMGATLPFFYKVCIRAARARGARIGVVTGANTLGALMGSVGTTWLFMGHLSGQIQMIIAATLNVIGAGIALYKVRDYQQLHAPDQADVVKAAPTAATGSASLRSTAQHNCNVAISVAAVRGRGIQAIFHGFAFHYV